MVMVVSIDVASLAIQIVIRSAEPEEKPLHAACAFKKFQLITVASKG